MINSEPTSTMSKPAMPGFFENKRMLVVPDSAAGSFNTGTIDQLSNRYIQQQTQQQQQNIMFPMIQSSSQQGGQQSQSMQWPNLCPLCHISQVAPDCKCIDCKELTCQMCIQQFPAGPEGKVIITPFII